MVLPTLESFRATPGLSPWKRGTDPSNLPSRELVAKAAAAGRQEVEENNRKKSGKKTGVKRKTNPTVS